METLTQDEMPNIVRLELTNTCNLQCPHCRHHSPEKKQPENYPEYYKTPVSMTEAQVDAIIDEIAPFKPSVTLNVANEPMIAPAFRYAVRKVKEAGLSGTFNTNGLSINEAIAHLLVDVQYDSVTVSVDAATSETLKLARGITNLDRLVENVEILRRVRGNKMFPRIGTTFVITDYNHHELPDFLAFWRARADFVRVTGYIKDGRPDVSYIPGWTREMLPARVPCKQIFRDIVIRANGDVTPCVITSENPDNFTLGNVFTDGGVRGVWNGAPMQRLRDLHNSGRWDEIAFCGPCDYWVETFNMKEEVKDGYLVRTPSPYTTFYNVIDRLGSWDKNRVHDRQGADNIREWEGSAGVAIGAPSAAPALDEAEIDS